jgi:hypothetical protein
MICASGSRERDVKRGILAIIIILNLGSRILIFLRNENENPCVPANNVSSCSFS